VDRRRFLKYAGGTAAAVGASAIGLDYFLKPRPSLVRQTSTTMIPSPPSIANFRWQPTRTVNGKVYDATVSLSVQSETPLIRLDATLDSHAPTIPARAYPTEPQRTLQFTPSQTIPGSYSTQINDLKGGKEYQLSVAALDSAGLQTKSQYETPYVRELENQAGTDRYFTGVFYYSWFTNPCRGFCQWSNMGAI
jgi:hypothetical protein